MGHVEMICKLEIIAERILVKGSLIIQWLCSKSFQSLIDSNEHLPGLHMFVWQIETHL